ncbi:MAG TPA: energy-coupling factor ABC transporter permease [Solirubrobacteraceae bacterium]|jgi:cobalt/nickel transport system permease protein|nr:energy-coupling factor ABC transporter permease [Solirubrobacteraceae bacterium]
MHIPDGFLSGEAVAIGWTGAVAGLGVAVRQAKLADNERQLPVAGLAAAFFLVGDAPLVPVTVGTQGHLLGGTLAVVLLGPWLGALTIAVVASIQALVLGDGGITTLGLTIVNLALVPALIGYPLVRLLRRVLPTTATALAVACGVAAFVCVFLAAVLFVTEVTVAAVVDIESGTLVTAMLGTYAVVGVVEGVITALIVRALLGVRPDMVRIATREHRRRRAGAPARTETAT